MIALSPVAWFFAVSQDAVPLTAPAGSAAFSAATSARICAAEPALANRYSICAAAGVPAGRRTAACAGTTHAPAVPVIERAYATTVSLGFPGAEVTVTLAPSGGDIVGPLCGTLLDSTIWPGRRAQWPEVTVRSSTGPPGEPRPITVTVAVGGGGGGPALLAPGGGGGPALPAPGGAGWVICSVTSGNGPAAPVTPGCLDVAASCAAVARAELTVAATWAPCCAANARSNGPLEFASRARPSVAAAESSSTRKITTVWVRCRAAPPEAALVTALGRMGAPAARRGCR